MAKRIAVVDNEKLKDMQQKKHIQSLCPVNRKGDDCIYFEDNKLRIDEQLCIGCGICVNAAPEAIKILNLPQALDKEPIHRYGTNAFALYNLPIPVFGEVVGLLGVNGIGKSTAIKILAGLLKPNLGIDKEADIQDIINYFKGTQAQLFFEKVKNQEIKVAYKPQHVDMIPKQYKGTVKDLLKSADQKDKLMEVAKQFELNTILDRDISNISGGELQRLAIAATFLRDANVYVFDEVTSYLDIKQRLKIAKAIRKLADQKTAVLVIEHDLIALDYMTDKVHVMYGRQGVFGVVSGLRPTRNAINSFLEGYLREENIRFRDHKIKFEKAAHTSTTAKTVLAKWPVMKKKLGSFDLDIKPGELHHNEKVGILGENGIGKTSFVKLLAGVIKPDNKELDMQIKVSYKPQYIDSTSDDLVMVVLQRAIERYDVELVRPLDLKPLFLKKISELSGGELQRVSIAYCLSQEAELYLLDEPSAYLDAEQRLITADVIKTMVEQHDVSALIVDHDLLFLDHLSDRLLVFKGKPAIKGEVTGPHDLAQGMNTMLEELEITLRRDELSNRPRINKFGSVKDREQKANETYYYV